MSISDPFESSRRRSWHCLCGRHRSQAEHDFEARLVPQPASAEREAERAEHRYRGVVVSAALRALPKGAPRTR